jgi:hypothetical protein
MLLTYDKFREIVLQEVGSGSHFLPSNYDWKNAYRVGWTPREAVQQYRLHCQANNVCDTCGGAAAFGHECPNPAGSESYR